MVCFESDAHLKKFEEIKEIYLESTNRPLLEFQQIDNQGLFPFPLSSILQELLEYPEEWGECFLSGIDFSELLEVLE
jgi:hypothetical protein